MVKVLNERWFWIVSSVVLSVLIIALGYGSGGGYSEYISISSSVYALIVLILFALFLFSVWKMFGDMDKTTKLIINVVAYSGMLFFFGPVVFGWG